MSSTEEPLPGFNALRDTKFTRTVHKDVYAAISPSRPELSQAGKNILIPGGGTGVGFAIAAAFVQADAERVIIVARRAEVLAEAASKLEQEAKTSGKTTKIITKVVDVNDGKDVDALWKWLADEGIVIDVFVANVARFDPAIPLLEHGTEGIWSHFETNVKSQLLFTEKFSAQGEDRQKFIIFVSTISAHAFDHPGVAERPTYALTKLSATLAFQLIAEHVSPKTTQIVSFHPGLIYSSVWASLGMGPEPFDNVKLPGSFAVWAASKEAEFLHGRFVWASWDVEELATGPIRKRIDEDPFYLRATIVGVKDDHSG